MTSSAAVAGAGLPPSTASRPQPPSLELAASSMAVLNVQDEEEQRRQQNYVRRTLMQYERQRMLDERRQGSAILSQCEEEGMDEINAEYDQNDILEALEADKARLSSISEGLSRAQDKRSNARVHFPPDVADSDRSNGSLYVRASPYPSDNAHNCGFRRDDKQDAPKSYHQSAYGMYSLDRPKNHFLGGGKAKQFGPDLVPARNPKEFYSENNSVAMDKLSKLYQSGGQDSFSVKSRSDAPNRSSSRGDSRESYPTYKKPLPPQIYQEGAISPADISSKRLDGLTGPQRRAIPNDYVPSKLIEQLRENVDASSPKPDKNSDVINDDVARRLSDAGHSIEARYGLHLHQCREELSRRLSPGGGTPAENAITRHSSSSSSSSSCPFRAEVRGGEGEENSPDEGYGTSDSRSSATTATSSLASPLSSSLSSLTTDSFCSLNGSQRLPTSPGGAVVPNSALASSSSSSAHSGGQGSAKAPPVPSGGRLVVARRPMLVKRKDLPPVDLRGSGGDSLEERLRALTTIEEEEQGGYAAGSVSAGPGLPHSSYSHHLHPGLPQPDAAVAAGPSPPLPPRAEGRPEPPKRKPDLSGPAPGPGPRAGQGEEDPGYDEGVYCLMEKRPQQQQQHQQQQPARPTNVPLVRRPLPGGRSGTDRAQIKDSTPTKEGDGTVGGREGGAGNLYRAVPVLVQPNGVPRSYSPANGHPRADPDNPAQPSPVRKTTAFSGPPRDGSSSSSSSKEVRFKAGGGGVKLNAESGRFEIDYSYYMKASPSESNDEVNTYSPDTTRAELSEMEVEEMEDVFHVPTDPRLRAQGPSSGRDPPRAERSAFRSPALHAEEEAARAGADFRAVLGRSAQKQARVHFQDGDGGSGSGGGGAGSEAGLRASGVMSSMPNLSLQTHSARHNLGGDVYGQDLLPSRYSSSEADFYMTASAGGSEVFSKGLQRHASVLLVDNRDSSDIRPASHRALPGTTQQQQPPPYRRNPTPGSGYPAPGARRLGQGDRKSCDVGSLYRQTDLSQTFPPASQGVIADRMSLNLGDLPRIQEQLRATSEMLLSTGKRHQFASSSDIYKLFQGQHQQQQQPPLPQQQQEVGFPQGRHPPYRHSFHHFASSQPPSQNLTEVRARARTSSGGQSVHSRALGKTDVGEERGQGPLRADHSLAAAVTSAYAPTYGGGGEFVRSLYNSRDVSRSSSDANLSSRDVSMSLPRDAHLGGRVTPSFRERLSRGEQFVTDVIQDHDGEKLSTLV